MEKKHTHTRSPRVSLPAAPKRVELRPTVLIQALRHASSDVVAACGRTSPAFGSLRLRDPLTIPERINRRRLNLVPLDLVTLVIDETKLFHGIEIMHGSPGGEHGLHARDLHGGRGIADVVWTFEFRKAPYRCPGEIGVGVCVSDLSSGFSQWLRADEYA
jgi:hypothetical protein